MFFSIFSPGSHCVQRKDIEVNLVIWASGLGGADINNSGRITCSKQKTMSGHLEAQIGKISCLINAESCQNAQNIYKIL